MSFCRKCGAKIPDDEFKLYSGQYRECNQLLVEDTNEDSLYPQFYPNVLKYLNKSESIPASFEPTPISY